MSEQRIIISAALSIDEAQPLLAALDRRRQQPGSEKATMSDIVRTAIFAHLKALDRSRHWKRGQGKERMLGLCTGCKTRPANGLDTLCRTCRQDLREGRETRLADRER